MPFPPPDRPVTAILKPTTPGIYFKVNNVWKQDTARELAMRELYEALYLDEDFETYIVSAFQNVLVVPKPIPTFRQTFREVYRTIHDPRKDVVAYATTEEVVYKFLRIPEFLSTEKYESFRRRNNLPGELGMLDGVRVVLHPLEQKPIASTKDGEVVFYQIERK